jgi:type II secretory pathway pseudopilin PulG
MRCCSPKRAFTLVEALAVIGVLVAVLALLIPSIRKSLRHTRATACAQRLRLLDQALAAYRTDSGGWLPVAETPVFGSPPRSARAAWYGPLFPDYLSLPSQLVCPSDPARPLIDLGVPLARHPDPANASSYGMNDVLRAAGLLNLDRTEPVRPSETILLADLGPDHARALGDAAGALGRSGGRLPWDDLFHPAMAGLTNSWLTERHFGNINVLTLGGAVQRVRTADMMIEPIRSYYGKCAAGGCPLCEDYQVPHYSFAPWRLYWWIGPIAPVE